MVTGTAENLPRNPANFHPLTPLSFLARTAAVYPDRTAWVHGAESCTYRAFHERCRRFAAALAARGIGGNAADVVAVMAPNVPCLLEAHYGVPMAGAVLNALNVRLDAPAIRFILEHSEAKLLIVDREFSAVAAAALAGMKSPPVTVDYLDPAFDGAGERVGEIDYEAFLASGDPALAPHPVADEWDAISVNYTSGTTGDPKGVVYHHRGACLNALGNQLAWGMQRHPVYLWTLPMFHCNGWCFPLDGGSAGRHACLPAARRGARHLPRHRATRRHPYVRRPHCVESHRQCADGGAHGFYAHGGSADRGITTAAGGDYRR